MKQYGFYFDAARCTGCKACQIACADKNGLEDGRFFRNVLPYESGPGVKTAPRAPGIRTFSTATCRCRATTATIRPA